MNENNSSHHVAWADRLGLNKQWSRDIERCSDAMGSEYYSIAVRRFRNNIINIKNGPPLRNIITSFVDVDLEDLKHKQLELYADKNPEDANDEACIREFRKGLDSWASEELYKFMIQLLEDHGFCFYESNIEEDEMK